MIKKYISSSKKILLFNVFPYWRSYELDMHVPLGMLYIANSLKKYGYSVRVYHIEERKIEECVNSIDFTDVLFVGIASILTGHSLRAAISLSKSVKRMRSEIPMVWGGIQPTFIPKQCLENNFVDFVGMGEGEELIVDIAKLFNGIVQVEKIKGLAYKNEFNEIVINERRPYILNLDDYKPDFSLIDLKDYIYNGVVLGLLISSRGCPYNCSFCYNNNFNNRRYRKHSPEYVISLLEDLKSKYDFSSFSFSDDNFFVDKDRAFKILDSTCNMNLTVFNVDVKINKINKNDIIRLNNYNVTSVFFGTESLQKKLIKLINKEQTKDEVINGIKLFQKYASNIYLQTEILIALPFETKEDMIKDINDGLDLYKYHNNFSLYFGILFPLPGTEMMSYAKDKGFDPQTIYDYVEIDLNNVSNICDQWVSWKMNEQGKNRLFITEKYSALLVKRKSHSLKKKFIFNIAKWRVSKQIFFLNSFDFYFYKNNILSKTLKYFFKKIGVPFKCSRNTNYYNFGYIPSDSLKNNIKGKLFGYYNFIKRLQAKDIMNVLNLQSTDKVLDLGCGPGYFTVEIAKNAELAVGVDVIPKLYTIKIPKFLQNKLKFIISSGTSLPFEDSYFDKVLACEVITMFENPNDALKELKRVLKPNGNLIISNGAGHPFIKNLFKRKNILFKILNKIFRDKMPISYSEYCANLQKSFGTKHSRYFSQDDIIYLLKENNFICQNISYTPGYLAGVFFSLSQFFLFLRKEQAVSHKGFIFKYHFFNFIQKLDKKKYLGGLLINAKNQK